MRAKFNKPWYKRTYRWKDLMDKRRMLQTKYSVRRRSSNQDWFWTEEWQEGERQADEDIANGDVEEYDTETWRLQ